VCPRSQHGRPAGWAPSSVGEVSQRSIYRGQIVWNQSQKRGSWGRQRRRERPETEWMRTATPNCKSSTTTYGMRPGHLCAGSLPIESYRCSGPTLGLRLDLRRNSDRQMELRRSSANARIRDRKRSFSHLNVQRGATTRDAWVAVEPAPGVRCFLHRSLGPFGRLTPTASRVRSRAR
jgi:hypothetical protein